jgi:heptaprenyl diphosphate synthase
MRIGLANLPLMLALDLFPLKAYALLALVKIAGQGIITGSLFSYVFLFSLGGSLSSAALMYLLRRLGGGRRGPLSLAGIGAASAFCSNAVQLLLARFLVFGEGVRYLIPPFLAAALFSGFALGIFCEIFIARSRWYALRRGGPAAGVSMPAAGVSMPAEEVLMPAEEVLMPAAGEPAAGGDLRGAAGAALSAPEPAPPGGNFRQRRREAWDRLFGPEALCAAGLVMALCLLFNPSVASRVLQFLAFWLLSWLSGRKQNLPVTFLVILFITVFNLLVPYGRVLASWGPFSLSLGSLRTGLRRAVTLEGLFMLSSACIRPGLRFPGSFGALLGDTFGILDRIQALAGAADRRRGAAFLTGRGKENLIPRIDRMLMELDGDETDPCGGFSEEPGRAGPGERRGPRGGLLRSVPLLVLIILIAAVLPLITGPLFFVALF